MTEILQCYRSNNSCLAGFLRAILGFIFYGVTKKFFAIFLPQSEVNPQQLTVFVFCFVHLLQSVDTSIYLPPSLFQSLPLDVNVKFQFIVYSNSKLFPEVTNESENKRSVKVFSSVVSAQFGKYFV